MCGSIFCSPAPSSGVVKKEMGRLSNGINDVGINTYEYANQQEEIMQNISFDLSSPPKDPNLIHDLFFHDLV